MKKSTLLLISFLIVSKIFSQTVSTTLEEYNYVTKGYSIQIESGLDMKKGYKIEPPFEKTALKGNFSTISYSILIREETKKLAAIILKVVPNNAPNRIKYLCIPVNNRELFERYYTDYLSLGYEISSDIARVTSVIAAITYSNVYSMLNK